MVFRHQPIACQIALDLSNYAFQDAFSYNQKLLFIENKWIRESETTELQKGTGPLYYLLINRWMNEWMNEA